jgi:hypothetical protein
MLGSRAQSFESPVSNILRWRFISAREQGQYNWRWERHTRGGFVVARSNAYTSYGACVSDALLHGYLAPETLD